MRLGLIQGDGMCPGRHGIQKSSSRCLEFAGSKPQEQRSSMSYDITVLFALSYLDKYSAHFDACMMRERLMPACHMLRTRMAVLRFADCAYTMGFASVLALVDISDQYWNFIEAMTPKTTVPIDAIKEKRHQLQLRLEFHMKAAFW